MSESRRHARVVFPFLLSLCAAAAAPAAPNYRQAPMLDRLTASGQLPPVAERLPDRPVVVRPVERVGEYGGTWRALYASLTDLMLSHRMGYETLMRWDRDGATVIPGIAERMEVRDNARTFVFHLRRGMRWSDGHPFTSADFAYFHRHVQRNKMLTPAVPSYWLVGGRPYDVETPDEHTVVFRFHEPYGMFPQMLAFVGRQNQLFQPAHYSKRFHPDFTDPDRLARDAAAAGYGDWAAHYARLHELDRNPDCPSVAPFVIRVPFPAQQVVAERNPYYWKVDPAGNQLPYIDAIRYDRVLDLAMLNLRALDGQVDFQNRGIDAANFTLLKEAGATRGYRVQADYATGTTGVYVNQYSRDEAKRPVLQDRRFRVALSLAVNRPEIIELIYNGLGHADNGVSMPGDPYFLPGMDQTHVRYDPAEANRLLDDLGLRRGPDGQRHWPDGQRHWPDGRAFHEVLRVFPAENGTNADLWQLVAEYFREVGLRFSVVLEDGPLSRLQVMAGQSDFFAYRSLSQHWALDGSFKVPVVNYSYHAPLYGHYAMTQGRKGVKPSDEQQRLIDWYEQMRSTPDDALRLDLGRRILRQWAEDIYFVGLVRPVELTVISARFRNVPGRIRYNYRLMTPGYIGIEQFYIDPSAAGGGDATPGPEEPVPYYHDPGKEG